MSDLTTANVSVTTSQTSSVSVSTEEEYDSNGTEVFNPNINNWNHGFWRSVFSAANGSGSTARVATLSIIWVTLGVLIYLVAMVHGVPEHLMTLGYFSTLLICVTYSPSKIIEFFQAKFGAKK